MPIYRYTARDGTGKELRGSQEADSEYTAVKILQNGGLLVTKVTEVKSTDSKGKGKRRRRRIKSEDLLFFVRQTAALLDAGVPLLRSVDIISGQSQSELLRETLERMKEDIKIGLTLKDAMADHPKIFPSLWIFLIEAGEASGNLPLVLTQLADNQEASINLRKKVLTALVYPSVVICVAVGVILVFLLFVLPRFAKIYDQFNAPLPAFTRVVIAFSYFLKSYILIIAAAVAGVVYFLKGYIRTPEGRRRFDGFILRLPLFGEFIRDSILARVSINLSTLLKSGVNILKSLEITGNASGNVLFETALTNAALEIQQGKTLASSLGSSGLFSPIMLHMIEVGEESAKVPDMMSHVARYYESRVDVFISRLSVLIEPVILVFIGGVVLILVVAMFLPIINLSQVIR